MEVLKNNDTLGIRLERDPDAARQYRVLADGELVYETNVESSALVQYADLAEERGKPFAERRAREAEFHMGASLHAERVARTKTRSAKATGGKGGRGGV